MIVPPYVRATTGSNVFRIQWNQNVRSPPTRYWIGGGVSPDRDLPDRDPPHPRQRPQWKEMSAWTETPRQRPPQKETPWIETPWTENPFDRNLPGQRPPGQRSHGQRPPGQRPPWTESPICHVTCGACWDRDAPSPCEQNHRCLWKHKDGR